MLVYFDTSAFAKLIVEEDGSKLARRWIGSASLAACSVITYAETCAVFARHARHDHHRRHGQDNLSLWHRELDARWESMVRIVVDEQAAGRLAIAHALRGMDAIHLAAALSVRGRVREQSAAAKVAFASFDRRLLRAAAQEDLATLGPLT